MSDPLDALRAYAEAPIEARAAMIRAHYAEQERQRIETWDRQHGRGAWERRRARQRADEAARPPMGQGGGRDSGTGWGGGGWGLRYWNRNW